MTLDITEAERTFNMSFLRQLSKDISKLPLSVCSWDALGPPSISAILPWLLGHESQGNCDLHKIKPLQNRLSQTKQCPGALWRPEIRNLLYWYLKSHSRGARLSLCHLIHITTLISKLNRQKVTETQRAQENKIITRWSPRGQAATPIQPIQTKNSIIDNYEEFPLRNRNAVYTLLTQEEDPEGTGHSKDDSWLRI